LSVIPASGEKEELFEYSNHASVLRPCGLTVARIRAAVLVMVSAAMIVTVGGAVRAVVWKDRVAP
jgi:hypothetical protein